MAQNTRVPATSEDYIDAMVELAYMAATFIEDADLGHMESHDLMGALRSKVEKWKTVRDEYLGPEATRYLRRSAAAHPAHEDLEPGADQ